MAVCKGCGLALLGDSARCPKCGAPTRAAVPPPASWGTAKDLEKKQDLQRQLQQALEPDTPPVPAPSPSRKRWMAAGLVIGGIIVVTLLGIGLFLVGQRNDATPYFPLAAGRTWTFRSATEEGIRFVGTLTGPSQIDGHPGWGVDVTRETEDQQEDLGRGWVSLGLLGFDLVGVDGHVGHHVFDMRMAAFPLRDGAQWKWDWRESFDSMSFVGTFHAVSTHEPLTVPAGTFDTVHVQGVLGQKLLGGQLQMDYWLARGTGPVRFDMLVPQGAYGLPTLRLELESPPK